VPPNNTTFLSIKYKLLQFLQYNNIYDLADHTNNSSYTWHSSRHHSTIDYIWAYLPLLKYLNSFYLDDAENCTQSDHKILISSWTFPHALTGKNRHSTRTKRRTFNYKAMNKEQWEIFADQVSLNLTTNKTPLSIQTSESLETTWHKIQTSIINAATKCIPNKKTTIRNFQHSFSAKATLLHLNLKKLNNITRQVKASLNNLSPIPVHLNSTIHYLNSTYYLNILDIPNLHELISSWITNTNTE